MTVIFRSALALLDILSGLGLSFRVHKILVVSVVRAFATLIVDILHTVGCDTVCIIKYKNHTSLK